jgi:ABC-2 type transport system permease protein
MRNVWTIYRRELATYFSSPIAYIFIALFVLILAFFFFVVNRFFSLPEPDLRPYFSILPWAFAVFIPAVTMRLWAEEKRAGTIELLMTLPLKSWEVVLGKYFAGYTVIAISLLLTLATLPTSLSFVVDLDWGMVIASYVGALVLAGVYIALGAWVSTFSQNQVVALLLALVLSFVAGLIGVQPVILFLNKVFSPLGSFVGWFGTYYHFEDFFKGLINPVGLIYAVSLSAFFLVLNNVFVEGRKY